jgi:hypothetical protein
MLISEICIQFKVHLTFKVISIIISVVIVVSAAGVILYRNYEKSTTGEIDFYIASDEVPNVTGLYITVDQFSAFNGLSWSNHSVYKTINLYLNNFSSPGLIAKINLPAHNYTSFKLYLSSSYIGVSGSYYNLSLTSNFTENRFNLTLAGGATINLLFGFKIAGNLNIPERTLKPVTTLTEHG